MILTADPHAAYAAHRAEILEAIARVLDGGRYILGEEVAAFEREFAQYTGTSHCIGVASGTDALHLALRACGIGPGDAVLTVSNTAVATVAAIHLAGAAAALVDIDPESMTLDPGRVEDTLRHQPVKAIVPVHLYGHPCNMDAIMEIAARHRLIVIEDCAQSHGAAWRGQSTGSFGHAGCFSFYPTKNLGALGDGGAVITSDVELAAKLRRMREYGWSQRYISAEAGMNTRLDELQAAVLRIKLRSLDAGNARRREIAASYYATLARSGWALPSTAPEARHAWHQYVIRTADRDRLRAYLTDLQIQTTVLYPVPIHLQPGYEQLVRIGAGGLEQTELASRHILSLPMHPYLTDEEVERVQSALTLYSRKTLGT